MVADDTAGGVAAGAAGPLPLHADSARSPIAAAAAAGALSRERMSASLPALRACRVSRRCAPPPCRDQRWRLAHAEM